jgi:hypothetical protein
LSTSLPLALFGPQRGIMVAEGVDFDGVRAGS